MGRRRKNPVSPEKQELFAKLIETYEVQTAKDLEEALKDLLGGVIETMLGQELEMQMAETTAADEEYHNTRNGYKPKRLRSSLGEIPIEVPQDRKGDFEPVVVPKDEKDITESEGKISAMYARGMSTRQISDQIRDIYGFEVSEGMVSGITNKLLPEIEAWQKRPLSAVYPIVFIDAIVFNVRENNVIRKQAAYIILGVSEEGHKEVLSIGACEKNSVESLL
jgi:transposase-like protein